MITTVPIAKFRRWCKGSLVQVKCLESYVVAKVAKIDTASMHQSGWCLGRRWIVDPNWVNEVNDKMGRPHVEGPRAMCEHMLELD